MDTIPIKTVISELKSYLLEKDDSLNIYERPPYGVAGTTPEYYIHPVSRAMDLVKIRNTKDTYGIIISIESTVSSEADEKTLWDKADEIIDYVKADDGYITLSGVIYQTTSLTVNFVGVSEDASLRRAHIKFLLTNYK